MYSIVTVIYGVPLNIAVSRKINSWESDEDSPWSEDNDGTCGFVATYHDGSSELIGYCGVELDTFDECRSSRKVSELNLQPTKEQVVEAKDKIAKLHPALHDLIDEESIYFIFSTS